MSKPMEAPMLVLPLGDAEQEDVLARLVRLGMIEPVEEVKEAPGALP